jgi:hypothetical protein
MIEFADELLKIADKLEPLSRQIEGLEVAHPLEVLENAANAVGKAWSGSCWAIMLMCITTA